MRLERLLSCTERPEEWAPTYAELEVLFNPGSPSGWSSHRVGISPCYNPDYHKQKAATSGQRLSPVDFPYYSVDQDDLDVLQANPSPNLLRFLGKPGAPALRLRFIVHPDALKKLPIQREPDGVVQAYPTVSTRTVLTANGNPLFLKLDYPEMIGRCPRRLGLPELHQSAFFSRRFDAWSQANLLSPVFGYLPESRGMLWRSGAGNAAIGMIGRETQVRPLLDERSIYIPFFALPTEDCSSPQDPTLLTQIICAHATGSVTPGDVLLHITGLIFEALGSLFERRPMAGASETDKFRVVHDCHGQNILLELDATGYPRRIVFRDFQHMYPVVLDEGDRADYLQAQNPFCKMLDTQQDPEHVRRKISQLVDCKLGVYVIERLVDDFAATFDCDRDDVIANIRQQFQDRLGLICEILPEGVWYRRSDGIELDEHGRIRLEQGPGKPLLRG
jgi:hypothetical protein